MNFRRLLAQRETLMFSWQALGLSNSVEAKTEGEKRVAVMPSKPSNYLAAGVTLNALTVTRICASANTPSFICGPRREQLSFFVVTAHVSCS